MIIHYLNIFGICSVPNKADAPLIIDTDAPLPFSVSCQSFKAISWRHTKRLYLRRRCNHIKLTQCHTNNGRKPSAFARLVQFLRFFASE